jgi:transposase-like protein
MQCPKCNSLNFIKKGIQPNQKQKFFCKNCQSYFIENPKFSRLTADEKVLIDKLCSEGNSFRAIGRIIGKTHQTIMSQIKKN